MHRLQELVRLHREGTRAREVARLLKMGPNTEREYREALIAAELLFGPPSELPELGALKAAVLMHRSPAKAPEHETSSIAEWAKRVETLMEKGLTARPIFDRLRQEEKEFTGSYWSVKRMVRRLDRERGVRPEDVAIPVETMPGEIAQVDFGYVGKLLCPKSHVLRRAWVFVMVLGYSRHAYGEVVFDQRASTWLALHTRAFEYLDGVPETIVPDNLKAAVIRAAFGVDGDVALNRGYRELARHYGFKIDPAPPYAPRKKGKVESSVKYVKRNALAGRDGENVDDVNRALLRWLEDVAGNRTHGTTRRRPLEVFREEEQAALSALPQRPYELVVWTKARVHQDAHVVFGSRLYSVPWPWVGHDVWLRVTASTVEVYANDDRVATHARQGKGYRSTIEAHLPEHRRDLRHRSRAYWENRAAAIGPETAGLVKEVFDSDAVLSQLRTVQAILTHLEDFPAERAEAASRRARFFGTYSYGGIKSILAKALDLEPLPAPMLVANGSGEPMRFARNVMELVAQKLEVSDEPC